MAVADDYLKLIQSFTIRSREGDLIPFRLNSAQRLVWDQYFAPRLNAKQRLWFVILKARREGISTLIEALILARSILADGVRARVIASASDNTTEIWTMAKTMWEESWVAPMGSKVAQTLIFGRSRIDVQTAGSPNAARGLDITLLHGSEVATWPKPETWMATMQCLPDHDETMCFLESTANGKAGQGALFHKEWTRAEKGESDFTPIFLPWFALDEYTMDGVDLGDLDEEEQALIKAYGLSDGQLRWRRGTIRNKCEGDVEKFHQEYPSTAEEAFVQSGRPFFTTVQLLPYWKQVKKGTRYTVLPSGKWIKDSRGPWEVFVEPIPGKQYGLGADSSMGLTDNENDDTHSLSTGCLLDWDSLEVVATYEASAAPYLQARDLVGMAKSYNNALICPEVQANSGGGGVELLIFIQELDYWHIHGWKQADKAKNRHDYHTLGWATNAKTRPRMLSRIREVITEQSVTIYSERLLKQLANFGMSDADRWEALHGHDDLLFAFGIALVSRTENFMPVPANGPDADLDWKREGIISRSEPNTARAWLEQRRNTQNEYEPSYLEM